MGQGNPIKESLEPSAPPRIADAYTTRLNNLQELAAILPGELKGSIGRQFKFLFRGKGVIFALVMMGNYVH